MIPCNPPDGERLELAAYKLTHRYRETKEEEFSDILSGAGVSTHWDGMTLLFSHPEGGTVNIQGTGQPLNSTGAVYVGEGVERFWQYDIRRWGGGFVVSSHAQLLDILDSFSSRSGQLVARVRYLDYHYTFDFENVGIVCPDDFFAPSPPDDPDSSPGPSGPYSCEPCPDRECLAPTNAATLNDILDRLDQLGAGEWVDLSPVVNALDERVKSIERLTIGFRQGRKAALNQWASVRQSATTELTYTENALNAFNQVLNTLLSSGYVGALFDELNDLLGNITLDLSSPVSSEMAYTSTCDESVSERLILQGTRLEVMSSAVQALASVSEATSCKLEEFAPMATWPEWWGTRHSASIPQVVTIYAPKDKYGNWVAGRYPVTVPHASQAAPVKYFWKGPDQGRLILADNSDLIVSCRSQGDAKSLISRLKSQIPASLRRDSHESYGKTTAGIGTEKVWRKRSAYFPNGQLSREPEWVKHYE